MESPEGRIRNGPTPILYIPNLPPSLSSWNALNAHFSHWGKIKKIVANPQKRWCTVHFITASDAKRAKNEGCIWKSAPLDAHFWVQGTTKSVNLKENDEKEDTNVLNYGDLDDLWSDDDVESFGIVKTPKTKSKIKNQSVSEDRKKKSDSLKSPVSKSKQQLIGYRIPKLKPESLDKSKNTRKKYENMEVDLKKVVSPLFKVKKKVESASLKTDKKHLKLSLKERFAILEERDKLIRKSLVKSSNVKNKAAIGTCPDMCPEKERIMREYRRLVSVYEMVPGTQKMDPALAVKAYVRSSADQEEPLQHELRPEPVLSMTMSYLISKIISLIEEPDVNISDWYDFCWDRLRSIRKDIIQQQLSNLETVTIIEQCARFHIFCYDRLWGADPSVFDEKINTENLMNCLQTLRHMYEDLSNEDVDCPNQPEFRAYMILLNMKTGDLMAAYENFSEKIQKEERVQMAVNIHLTFNNSMYSQFFKLVKKATYLEACILQRYFYHVRVKALQVITRAYCPPNKGGSIPIKQMMNILKFDSPDDTILFCISHGITIKENGKDFRLYRNGFVLPETKEICRNSSSLVTQKRLPVIRAVVGDINYALRDYKNHKVHSSFNQDGKLNDLATDASDQKSKLIEKDIERISTMDEDEYEDEDIDNDFIENENYTKMEVDTDYPDSESKIYLKNEPLEDDDVISDNIESELQPDVPSFKFDPYKFDSYKLDSERSFNIEPSTSKIKNKFSNEKVTSPIPNFTLPKFDYQSTFDQSQDKEIKQSKYNFSTNQLFQNKNDNELFSLNKNKPNQQVFNIKESFNINSDHNYAFKSPLVKSEVLKNDEKMVAASSLPFISIKNDSDRQIIAKGTEDINSSYKTINNNEEISDSLRSLGNVADIKYDVNKDLKFISSSNSNQDSSLLKPIDKVGGDSEVEPEMYKLANDDVERKLNKTRENLQMLRKDLRKRLKATAPRYYARKWKKKVDKLKQVRKNFPVIDPITPELHISIWGTVVNLSNTSKFSLLNRLKQKQKYVVMVNSILDNCIINTLPFYGQKIFDGIMHHFNYSQLEVKDFTVPWNWKLIISLPFLNNNTFFMNKFEDFFKRLFYKWEHSRLGNVVKMVNSAVENPLYYCVYVLFGNDFQPLQVTGMSAALFLMIDDVECPADKYKRLRNLFSADQTTNSVPIAMMNIGTTSEDKLFDILINKILNPKIHNKIKLQWKDIRSVEKALSFLTNNTVYSSKLRIFTLNSLFKLSVESIFYHLSAIKDRSPKLKTPLSNPNIIIKFFNVFFHSLKVIICNFGFRDYDVVPMEFKKFVEYNKRNRDDKIDIGFEITSTMEISNAFSKLKLYKLENWPPCDDEELLKQFSIFCNDIKCDNILPRIIRYVDHNYNKNIDFVQHINNNVNWVYIMDLVMNSLLEKYNYDHINVVVICDMNEINSLLSIKYCYKLLNRITSESLKVDI